MRSFIESIEVDDGEITFNYTLPLPPDELRQETVSVLGMSSSSPPFVGAVFPQTLSHSRKERG